MASCYKVLKMCVPYNAGDVLAEEGINPMELVSLLVIYVVRQFGRLFGWLVANLLNYYTFCTFYLLNNYKFQ